MESNKLLRTFWPVGQGAFYSELFYNDEQSNGLVVYDCGTLSPQRYVWTCIHELRKRCCGVNKSTEKPIIDVLFISHFHYDHISGINQLMELFNVKKIILPVIPSEVFVDVYLNNYIYDNHKGKPTLELLCRLLSEDYIDTSYIHRFDESDIGHFDKKIFNQIRIDRGYDSLDTIKRIIPTTTIINLNNWQYIPFNYPCEQSFKLFNVMNEHYPELVQLIINEEWKEVKLNVDRIGIKKIKQLYSDIYKNDQNEESMTVLSCPSFESDNRELYCLYTGDSPFRHCNRLSSVKVFYADYWKKFGVLQVPHHGADDDNVKELFDHSRQCVVCYGKNRFGHPGDKALNNMEKSNSKIIHVTNISRPICFSYNV